MTDDFFSPYRHGFVRIAAIVPELRVANPSYNAEALIPMLEQAHERGASCVVLPELALSGYSCDDLLHQDALLDASVFGLAQVVRASTDLQPLFAIGMPLRVGYALYNVAVVFQRGRVLGVVPKSFLPNYREFYEKRHFSAARDAIGRDVELLGERVPFGPDLIFECASLPAFKVHVEICEDLWVPIPPSTLAALAGATVLLNLSASNITIGKAEYRRLLCESHSARCLAAYAYAGAGFGESTTDLAWDGHALICENGETLAQASRFSESATLTEADVDLDRLRQERMRMSSWRDQGSDHADALRAFRRVPFEFEVPRVRDFIRRVPRFPYVPADPTTRDARCAEVFQIQVHGLERRVVHTQSKSLVIGVSGGLDSTLALMVAVETADRLKLPRDQILGFTMPGYATSTETRDNALALMHALGVTSREIDIRPSCLQMLKDLDHPYARGEPVFDITFENVQAGERTSHLFRLANQHRGLVIGTGDLSELALGWCTYGVGDQMAHYNVNGSVPKTLLQYLVHWAVATHRFGEAASAVLERILGTVISPELVPAGESGVQSTEAAIGPYALQDFNLYFTTRFGYRPAKVAFLAWHAWHDAAVGAWPDLIPTDRRVAYDLSQIKRWLRVFVQRFFGMSQFKRSAMPNGPKVGSGGALSPRGDWRAPSDAEATLWLDAVERDIPDSESAG